MCSLLLFVDSIGHDLRDVRDELEAQAQEKNKVKNQIEETTEKINSRAIDLDMWKGEVAVVNKLIQSSTFWVPLELIYHSPFFYVAAGKTIVSKEGRHSIFVHANCT